MNVGLVEVQAALHEFTLVNLGECGKAFLVKVGEMILNLLIALLTAAAHCLELLQSALKLETFLFSVKLKTYCTSVILGNIGFFWGGGLIMSCMV